MADWNLFQAVGVDPQLVTAGTAGGMVKALVWRQKLVPAIASMLVGAAVASYAGAPLAKALSKIDLFGLRVEMAPELGAFLAGIFAYWGIEIIASKLTKTKDEEPRP